MNDFIMILGNGFDLDLGLRTTYSEFWNSKIWSETKNNCPERYLISSLERYRITHNWFDLESGLLDGAQMLKKRLTSSFDNSNYKNSFRMLVNQLKEYLLDQQTKVVPNTDSVAKQILEAISSGEESVCIYSFNYTDVETIGKQLGVIGLPHVYHLHGSLKDDDQIILGVELEDFTSIPDQLTFLIKSNNPYYKYNHMLKDLESTDNVIFFGHSINGMDFPYFKDYFLDLSDLSTDKSEMKHITIITKDESSEMQIKDNFRRNGIDVRTLFNRVELEFIMTDSIYNGNQRELDKLDNLLSQFSSYD